MRAIAAGALLMVAYLAVTTLQVWAAATRDGAAPAGAIVVLGAAQYDGEPSPVLRARLDHAAALFHEGLAPIVVVTGGRRPGDRFTEASAAARYLHRQGVPDAALRREVSGRSTWESLAATERFLQREGVRDVLLVTDPLHAYRVAATARELGFAASVSPSASGPADPLRGARQLGRETVAVAVGRLVGYRRLTSLAALLQFSSPLAAVPPPAQRPLSATDAVTPRR